MGAWSHTSFGNDAAHDFLYEVEEDEGAIESIVQLIEGMAADEYIDSGDACSLLAGGELLAAAAGKPAKEDFPELAGQLAAKLKPDASLRARAAAAIRRVLAASELRDLWEETDDFDVWVADANGLLERLK